MTWYLLNQFIPISVTTTVPLCFYQTEINQKIDAPEMVTITLTAMRSEMRKIDFSVLAAHIDVREVKNECPFKLAARNLFLPSSIKLLHYEPAPLKIQVHHALKSDITTSLS